MKRSMTVCAALIVSAFALNANAVSPTPVLAANPKAPGVSAPNVLSPELQQIIAAQGSMPIENATPNFPFYGYNGDGPMLPAPGDIQSVAHNVEATKTEPDKNVYLVLHNQHGPDQGYNYGTHFLFQGHESGVKDASGKKISYVTRVNLDADAKHRITLMATQDKAGNALPPFDGITWNPFAHRLLLTAEAGNVGGVWQMPVTFPSVAEDLSGAMGRGGYEGIQNDSHGNIWIVEDVGGKTGTLAPHAKQANSFIYRFVPRDKADLTKGGRLQALQVASLAHAGQPIVFHAGDPDADILSQDVKDLHTYGKSFRTKWVTIHDTDVDGNVPFDANALAKAKLATPFKRPENGLFRPGSDFREFYFDETGDTNSLTEAAAFGGFGSIMKLRLDAPGADAGTLSMVYKGDVAHTGFDNVAFWDEHRVVFVEDGGDGLHSQRNALDSAYLFDLRTDYSNPLNQPVRILAQGRDPSATIDSALLAGGQGFQNDGDNEITGTHISDGDASIYGLLGYKIPRLFKDGWRFFYTQQHGDNVTYEVISTRHNGRHWDFCEEDERRCDR